MRAMVSQITGVSIVRSPYCRGRSKKTSKLRVIDLCAGNPPVAGGFPLPRASDAENIPFDNVIMIYNESQAYRYVWVNAQYNSFTKTS